MNHLIFVSTLCGKYNHHHPQFLGKGYSKCCQFPDYSLLSSIFSACWQDSPLPAPASLGRKPFSATRTHLPEVYLARSARELTLPRSIPQTVIERAAPQVGWSVVEGLHWLPEFPSRVEVPLPTTVTCLITHPLSGFPSSAYFLTTYQCILGSPPNIYT